MPILLQILDGRYENKLPFARRPGRMKEEVQE